MTLKEQLEKVEKDLERLEEKKKDLLEKKKKVLAEIELDEAKKAAEKNQKIVDVIEENFGEMTEENFEMFCQIMERQRETIRMQKNDLAYEGM